MRLLDRGHERLDVTRCEVPGRHEVVGEAAHGEAAWRDGLGSGIPARPPVRRRGLIHQAQAGRFDQRPESAPDVRRPSSFDTHRVAHLLLDVGISNVESQGRPIGVDEADAPAGTHHSSQLADRGRGIGHPLQHTLATRGIEPVVRRVEPERVANREVRCTT